MQDLINSMYEATVGSGQRPSRPAPTVVDLPAPGAAVTNPVTGVSVEQAEQCDNCTLEVGQNSSTSVVTLTRSMPAGQTSQSEQLIAQEIIGSNPCGQGATLGNEKTVRGRNKYEKLCVQGGIRTYFRLETVENIGNYNVPQCDEGDDELENRVGLENGRVRVKCGTRCPNTDIGCPNEQQPNPYIRTRCQHVCDRTGSGRRRRMDAEPRIDAGERPYYYITLVPKPVTAAPVYASDKKLFITPDKPFMLKFKSIEFAVNKMAIYRPCPIRIENVQADAVLSLNDYSDPTAKVVILIPLSATLTYGAAGDFVGRIMQNVNGFVYNEQKNTYNPITMSSGHDWQLTKLLESTQDANGVNTVSKAYFKWDTDAYEKYEVSRNSQIVQNGWRKREGTGITTILMQEPVGISYLTSSYLQLLPYAPSSESAPPPPVAYVYSPPKCTTCTRGPAITDEKLNALRMQAQSLMDPKTLAFLVSMFFIALVAMIAIYFALDSALGGNGRFFMSGPVSIAGWLAAPRPAAPTPQ